MPRTRDTRPAPLCPVHGVSMLVRRTMGEVQYRYCSAPGCRESTRTRRALPDPPPSASPVEESTKATPPVVPRDLKSRVDGPTAVGAGHVPRAIVNRAIKTKLELLARWRASRIDSPPDAPVGADGASDSFSDPRRR